MFALFSSLTVACGYEDTYIVAVFSTKEKADDVLAKFSDHFPTERFYVDEYIPPKIDPTFEDLICEGITKDKP
jgi:hypothetical protein